MVSRVCLGASAVATAIWWKAVTKDEDKVMKQAQNGRDRAAHR
jgi:hypothetical protein